MNANHKDACPKCGAHVESNITYAIGVTEPGGKMREPDTQARRCPECDTPLRRSPGEAWRIDDRPQ